MPAAAFPSPPNSCVPRFEAIDPIVGRRCCHRICPARLSKSGRVASILPRRQISATHLPSSDYENSYQSDRESRSTWARLIAQVYEADPLICPRCSAPMRILAVITEPEKVRKILRHLVEIGRSPPGLDQSFV
jgi:hypothetical protein